MSRLPRRSSRIKPPLRGRLAVSLSPERQKDYSIPVIRSRPSITKNIGKELAIKSVEPDIANEVMEQSRSQPETIPPITEDRVDESSQPQGDRTLIVSWSIGLAIAIILVWLLHSIELF